MRLSSVLLLLHRAELLLLRWCHLLLLVSKELHLLIEGIVDGLLGHLGLLGVPSCWLLHHAGSAVRLLHHHGCLLLLITHAHGILGLLWLVAHLEGIHGRLHDLLLGLGGELRWEVLGLRYWLYHWLL